MESNLINEEGETLIILTEKRVIFTLKGIEYIKEAFHANDEKISKIEVVNDPHRGLFVLISPKKQEESR